MEEHQREKENQSPTQDSSHARQKNPHPKYEVLKRPQSEMPRRRKATESTRPKSAEYNPPEELKSEEPLFKSTPDTTASQQDIFQSAIEMRTGSQKDIFKSAMEMSRLSQRSSISNNANISFRSCENSENPSLEKDPRNAENQLLGASGSSDLKHPLMVEDSLEHDSQNTISQHRSHRSSESPPTAEETSVGIHQAAGTGGNREVAEMNKSDQVDSDAISQDSNSALDALKIQQTIKVCDFLYDMNNKMVAEFELINVTLHKIKEFHPEGSELDWNIYAEKFCQIVSLIPRCVSNLKTSAESREANFTYDKEEFLSVFDKLLSTYSKSLSTLNYVLSIMTAMNRLPPEQEGMIDLEHRLKNSITVLENIMLKMENGFKKLTSSEFSPDETFNLESVDDEECSEHIASSQISSTQSSQPLESLPPPPLPPRPPRPPQLPPSSPEAAAPRPLRLYVKPMYSGKVMCFVFLIIVALVITFICI